MEGPFDLTSENVAKINRNPGVYILGYFSNGKNCGAYVGRSDTDLRDRMEDHLPENERNDCLRGHSLDRYWREYCASALEAYNRECEIYHEHGNGSGYTCNVIHPSKSNPRWTCPVCGE